MNMPSKMNPKGLKQSPLKPLNPADIKPEKIDVPNVPMNVDTDVNIFDILKLWVKENLINDILNSRSQKGVIMNSKMWYASKTLWVNALTLIWQFVGPLVGLPTLSPELLVTLLGVINLILRLITSSEVSFS